MKRMNLKSALSAALLIGGPIAATSALAQSQGGYGMGPGMMGGYGPVSDLNLSPEQRSKIAKIQDDARHK